MTSKETNNQKSLYMRAPEEGPLLQLNFECLLIVDSNSCDLSSGTRHTIQPPQPAPVSRAPMAPWSTATRISSSSLGWEHSYRSRQLLCDSFISCPRTWTSALDSHTLRYSCTLNASSYTCSALWYSLNSSTGSISRDRNTRSISSSSIPRKSNKILFISFS